MGNRGEFTPSSRGGSDNPHLPADFVRYDLAFKDPDVFYSTRFELRLLSAKLDLDNSGGLRFKINCTRRFYPSGSDFDGVSSNHVLSGSPQGLERQKQSIFERAYFDYLSSELIIKEGKSVFSDGNPFLE